MIYPYYVVRYNIYIYIYVIRYQRAFYRVTLSTRDTASGRLARPLATRDGARGEKITVCVTRNSSNKEFLDSYHTSHGPRTIDRADIRSGQRQRQVC
jgi:hypothetical protein